MHNGEELHKLFCSNPLCGALIERGVFVPMVIFPDDTEGTIALLRDSLHHVSCPICGTVVEGRELYYFAFKQAKFIAAWAPPEWADEARTNLETSVRGETRLTEDFDIFVSADRNGVRGRVLECLIDYSWPMLMDYLAVAQEGEQQLGTWASRNVQSIDRTWISALGVISKVQREGTIWYVPPGGDEPLPEGVLQECLDRLIVLKMPQVIADCLEEGKDVATGLAEAIPPMVLTEGVLHSLAQQCQEHESEEISAASLVWEVALAWSAWQLDCENPRYWQWVGTVESWAASPNSKDRPGFLSRELLQGTIRPQNFWDQFRDLVHQEGRQWDDVLEFGMVNGLFEGLSLGSLLDLADIPAEAARVSEARLKAQLSSASGSALSSAIRVAWRSGLESVARNLADWGLQKFGRDHAGDACWVKKAVCEELVRTERYAEALSEGRWVDANLSRAENADPEAVFGLLNELGNAHRYLVAYPDAYSRYTQAIRVADRHPEGSFQRHVVLRNIAIVLRQSGRVKESLRLFRQVWATEELTRVERANCGESLASAAFLMGRYEEGLQYVEESLVLLSDLMQAQADLVDRLRLMAAQGYLATGRPEIARTSVQQIRVDANQEWLQLLAGVLEVEANLQLGRSDDDFATQLLQRLEGQAREPSSESRELTLVLQQGLIPLLEGLKAYDRIRSLADEVGSPTDWVLTSAAARAAFQQRDFEASLSYAERAWRQVAFSLQVSPPSLADVTAFARMRKLQHLTGGAYWTEHLAGHSTVGELARAAELQSSNVLAVVVGEESRAWQRLVENRKETANTLEWLCPPDQDVVALHFLDVGLGVVPVITSASGIEAVGSLIEHPLIEAADNEFRSAMETYNPSKGGDPFARTPNWRELSEAIGASLPRLSEGAHIFIIPSDMLSDLPLHLCPVAEDRSLGAAFSWSYIPNLTTLRTIRARRTDNGHGEAWRPSRCGMVTSWRAGEREEIIAALVDGTNRFAESMEAIGCASGAALVGPDATPDAFSDLAGSVDLLRIACHGVGMPGMGRHGFLLGDGDTVSPGLTNYVLSDVGQRFILDWEELQDPTAPLVFSCACSSGSSSYMAGGERVGLDRVLLPSGTQSYLAPLWDIDAQEAQEAVDEIIHSYTTNTSQTLGETLQRYLAEHSLSHTNAALALFGDYL